MGFPDRIRLPLQFDPARLESDLARVASPDWIAHFVPQNYEGDWSVIPLRGVKGAVHPVMQIYADPSATEFENTAFLQPGSYLESVLGAFRCELQTARLMRLGPGSIIKEHDDNDLDAELGIARIHVPITTNAETVFEVNRSRVPMQPGEAWYLRLSDPHRVANRGTTARVHLVFDAVVNDWLLEQMRAGCDAVSAPAETV